LVAKDGTPILHSRENGLVTLYQVLSESGNQLSGTIPYIVAGVVAVAIILTAVYVIKIRKRKGSRK